MALAEPAPAAGGRSLAVDLHGGAMMEFVWIEPGTFAMGSPLYDPERRADEGPVRQVAISKGFYLGRYEVTQAQWLAVMGTAPWTGKRFVVQGADRPAVYISWTDLEEFLRRLNEAAGATLYRLPTEAEWEYACRAGTTTRWFFGDDVGPLGDYAWFIENGPAAGLSAAQPVGGKRPSPWGLYDIYGNAWEWVHDWYQPAYPSLDQVDPAGPSSGAARAMRGGGFINPALEVRSAKRFGYDPTLRFNALGARLVRTRE